MAATTVAVILFTLVFVLRSSGQILNTGKTDHGICKEVTVSSYEKLSLLNGCVVILGNLKLLTLERTNSSHYKNIRFTELREVTGYVIIYRVLGLESVGQLFPNLARIRGTQLFDNYGLIIHDLPNLLEVGLYSLIKIDRGGVVVGGGSQTCYVLTVDWDTLAPRSRHVLTPADDDAIHCSHQCICTTDEATNHCWNNLKCQRYLEGPDGERCNEQCLGCRNTNSSICSVCRYYTHKDHCVPKCPSNTLVIPENQYCVTQNECEKLNRWSWNNTCIDECPIDYVKKNKGKKVTCEKCPKCHSTCRDLKIQTLSTLQAAGRCVYVNGTLTIHIRSIPDAMEQLQTYLSRIEEVRDAVVIYGSLIITSLNFLSSLRVIKGVNLEQDAYSLVIRDMESLQTLFTPNVTKNLKIEKGKLKAIGNPVLCMNKIEEISTLFPLPSNDTDIPVGMNGYSGGCNVSSLDFIVKVWNDTSATIVFHYSNDTSIQYTALYVRLPRGSRTSVVPETCSDLEWYAVPALSGFVDLQNLRPASTYAVCIETYSYSYYPAKKKLARSKIVKFKTPIGKPAPPFIIELVAFSSDVVVIRWVDHKDYSPHITHYELDVELIELNLNTISTRDHCESKLNSEIEEDSRHAVVLRPPPDYDRGCESMCGVLSTLTAGAMVEEYFDVCNVPESDCDNYDDSYARTNKSVNNYVTTFSADIKGPRNDFQVGGLRPYRDYRFKLRTCIGKVCSRATRSVVRTLRSKKADMPIITSYSGDSLGHISVAWVSPKITNGPILTYLIQVWPYLGRGMVHSLPQTWCELPKSNTSYNVTVKSQNVSKYKIRVCSSSLGGSVYTCTEWKRLFLNKDHSAWLSPQLKTNNLWAGVLFGFCIVVISLMIAYIWNYRCMTFYSNDNVPLVENMEMNECGSSSVLNDIVPSYTIPLRDTVLNY